jgi:hypothetical protein
MIDLLMELEPESRFIHIDRPIEESIRSLVDRSAKARGWLRATPEQCERLQRALWEAKMEGLERVAEGRMLTVSYPDLLAAPDRETGRIVDCLGLRVGHEQRRRAIQLVESPVPPVVGSADPPIPPSGSPSSLESHTLGPLNVRPA